MSIRIKKIDFNNKNDSRILESALKNWFKDPKELNLVEPRLHYPFNLKKWEAISYRNSNAESFTLINNKWVIGIGSIIYSKDFKSGKILHIYIDLNYRRKGFATNIVQYLEKVANNKKINILTIRIMPNNEPAKSLFTKLGFSKKIKDTITNNKEATKLYKKIS
tara:strand:+ start:82 stop:573 length:492 start_codon:yes stop_codon:yes gene_type:complete